MRARRLATEDTRFTYALLASGATAVTFGILVDVARLAGADSCWSISAHLAIALGALANLWMLILARPAADWQSGWLVRTGRVVAAVVALAVVLDLLVGHRDPAYWLTVPHLVIALAATILLFVTSHVASRGLLDDTRRSSLPHRWWGTYLMSLLLVLVMLLGADHLGRPNLWRSPTFYVPSSLIFPALLVMAALRFDGRWNATLTATWYTILAWSVPTAIVLWDPPTPGGSVTLAPTPIVVALLLPAVATDLVVQLSERPVRRALWIGATFTGLFVAFHWLAAPEALGSWALDIYPALERWPQENPPEWPDRLWVVLPGRRADVAGVMTAWGLATISAYAGLRLAWNSTRTR